MGRASQLHRREIHGRDSNGAFPFYIENPGPPGAVDLPVDVIVHGATAPRAYSVTVVTAIDGGAEDSDVANVVQGDDAEAIAAKIRALTKDGITMSGAGDTATFTPTTGGTEITTLDVTVTMV